MRASRLLAALHKEAVQNFRDWKMLSLTLTFAPIFVLLMFYGIWGIDKADIKHISFFIVVNPDLLR